MTLFRTAALFAAITIGSGLAHAQDDTPLTAKQKQNKQLKQQQRQADILERLLALPPNQQQQILDQMAPARRKQAEALLQAWQLLSDDERANLKGRFAALMVLPPPRRQAVRKEIQILRLMTPEDRRTRLAQVKPRFSDSEMKILYGVAGLPEPQE
jgi:hypothetical protein